MSQFTFPIYRFHTDRPSIIQPPVTDSQTTLNATENLNVPTNSHNLRYIFPNQMATDLTEPIESSLTYTPSSPSNPTQIPLWYPSRRLRSLHTRFYNTILYQHICVPWKIIVS